ncbi:MAG: hypothetical protein LBM95_02085 [Lactobacillales bacterium]|jgi:Ca2+-dependent lipid-binding protein|nr:hypothetical protein [Lactobacillales bacterium]
MHSVRRFGFILFILILGIILGSVGVKWAILSLIPLFILWLLAWDEKRFRRHVREQRYQEYYQQTHFRRFP